MENIDKDIKSPVDSQTLNITKHSKLPQPTKLKPPTSLKFSNQNTQTLKKNIQNDKSPHQEHINKYNTRTTNNTSLTSTNISPSSYKNKTIPNSTPSTKQTSMNSNFIDLIPGLSEMSFKSSAGLSATKKVTKVEPQSFKTHEKSSSIRKISPEPSKPRYESTSYTSKFQNVPVSSRKINTLQENKNISNKMNQSTKLKNVVPKTLSSEPIKKTITISKPSAPSTLRAVKDNSINKSKPSIIKSSQKIAGNVSSTLPKIKKVLPEKPWLKKPVHQNDFGDFNAISEQMLRRARETGKYKY
ncbi:hypothetical protein BB559_003220 [Furculomyces boomerangus]|uniref:Uncharacterized protein n=1 Tax=Furculomyces boomerangus TaxID=61424 RepID=A0A2T9YMR9_9FUNG|nr:hypothetical protein BB559_003220 [Furculomyces boomerangus]